MKKNIKPIVSVAALITEKNELLNICEHYGFVGDVTEASAKEVLSSCELSKAQKVLLTAYAYLYFKLTKGSIEKVNEINSLLHNPKAVLNVCAEEITKPRTDFIRQELEHQNKAFYFVFIENDDYICDMLTAVAAAPVREDKKILTNLNSKEYEHPTDRTYLNNLNSNKTLEKILKIYSEYRIERMVLVQYTGSNVLVTEKNIPYLYNALKTVCEILDVSPMPPLYVQQGFINACTVGSSNPIIVISSLCTSLLTYDELLFILGHEVGHIKSQHVLYHSIGTVLPYIGNFIGNLTLGIGDIAFQGLLLLLYQWYRKSEFTADRAGLIACQNKEAAISLMAKLAGYPPNNYEDIDIDLFLEQSIEFDHLDDNTFNKIMKYLSVMYKNHPWTVARAQELDKWIKDGSYNEIIQKTNRPKPTMPEKPQIFTTSNCCPNCGNSNPNKAKFCVKCGKENLYYNGHGLF